MFLNKIRCYPAGTFIPTSLRLVAIIQLCLAFTVLIACVGYPFLGELFETKSKMAVYESVATNSNPKIAAYYANLPSNERANIEKQHEILQKRLKRPLSAKLHESASILIRDIPLFQKMWIFFAILLPLILLLRIEGAAQATWVLPIITLAYAINCYLYGIPHPSTEDLFPSEQVLEKNYLGHTLSGGIFEQRAQLLKAWDLYLIQNWSKEIPSENPGIYKEQIDKGKFLFNKERLTHLKLDFKNERTKTFNQKKSLFLLMVYLIWNLFFALLANKKQNF